MRWGRHSPVLIAALVLLGIASDTLPPRPPEIMDHQGLIQSAHAQGRQPAAACAEQQSSRGPWVLLGPFDTDCIPTRSFLGVSPNWLFDHTLLAARVRYTGGNGDKDILRTTDGGKTWERLPDPSPPTVESPSTDVASLALAATKSGPPISFLVAGNISLRQATTWSFPSAWWAWRSEDLGSTWNPVAQATSEGVNQPQPALTMSPSVADDGQLALVAGGYGWLSADWGKTWTLISAAGNQYVGAIAFSPNYARDQTIALTVMSGPPGLFNGRVPGAVDFQDSWGILLSHDGGTTWDRATAGLEVEGEPYLAVQLLQFSPAYDGDATLFAFAWRLRELSATPQAVPHRALFRSTDRGATWEEVFTPSLYGFGFRVKMALSPRFGMDGTGLFSYHGVPSGGAGSGVCAIVTTADGGATWQERYRAGPYSGRAAVCANIEMVDLDGDVVAFANMGALGGRFLVRSLDGGRSWTRDFDDPRGGGLLPQVVVGQTAFAVESSTGRIFMRGPAAQGPTANVP
jgi:photosystem II stability/assembly factor-like uncharacterized protein